MVMKNQSRQVKENEEEMATATDEEELGGAPAKKMIKMGEWLSIKLVVMCKMR